MAAKWQVPGEAGRFTLRGFTAHRLELQPGPLAVQLDAHLLTFAIAPGRRLQRVDGGHQQEVGEQPGLIGLLPAGALLEAEILEPVRLDAIEIPRVFVRHAGAGALPHLAGVLDPVAYQAAALIAAVASDPDETARSLVPVDQIMRAVVARLLRHVVQLSGAKIGTGRLDAERLARVRDHIAANLHQRITLEELAGVAALSTEHFARAFMCSIGTSPARYVLEQRVRHAQAMLIGHPQQLVSAIAADAGFASQSHMCAVFRRQVGMSPSAYRARDAGEAAESSSARLRSPTTAGSPTGR